MNDLTITDEAIRSHLLTRVEGFCERSKMSVSAVGKAAVNDDRFIANVRRGDNFTIKTYQRVIDWLNANEVAA